MKSRLIFGGLSLALAAGLFVAGCSSLPTSPAGSVPTGDSSATTSPGTVTLVTDASRSAYVRAILGGTVQAGNFHVVIPPGALTGDAIVTVRQPDITQPVVELSITPEERNGFLLPVLLVADARPMDVSLLSASYMSWWNPETKAWERCPESAVLLESLSVQAPLWHFSNYRVECDGKAGW